MRLLFIIKEATLDPPKIRNARTVRIPLNMKDWTEQQKAMIEGYDIFDKLRTMKPVLVDTETYESKVIE